MLERITALMPSSFPEYSPTGVGENPGNEFAFLGARIFFLYSCWVLTFTFTLRARGREITCCTKKGK